MAVGGTIARDETGHVELSHRWVPKEGEAHRPLRPDVLAVQEVEPIDNVLLFAGDCQPTFRDRISDPVYTIAHRTREFGLRMALGADPAQLRGLVLWQVARMTPVGGTIGLAAALGLGTAARSLLYGLEGYDPLVVSLSVVLLMLVAFGAGLLPALRASRINLVRALCWQ
jgi:hypothetical protein